MAANHHCQWRIETTIMATCHQFHPKDEGLHNYFLGATWTDGGNVSMSSLENWDCPWWYPLTNWLINESLLMGKLDETGINF